MISVPAGAGTASDAVDFPGTAGGIGKRENFRQAVSDDSSNADDESDALVGLRRLIFVEFLLRKPKEKKKKR